MKAKNKTRDFYRTNIVNNIIGLEEKRKFIIKKIVVEQVLPAVILLGTALIFIIMQDIGIELIIGISCLLAAYCWWFYDAILQEQIQTFKNSIVSEMLNFIEQNLNYRPQQKVAYKELKNSRIINDKIDRYTGEEYVEGRIRTAEIKFSKVVAKREVKNAVRDTDWDILLEGIFFVADFKEEFNTNLVIETDIAERIFENLSQSMQRTAGIIDNPFKEGEVIRLDDSEFEEKFKLVGTDKKAVDSLLTPKLRKKILRLKKEVKHHKHILPCLRDNKISEKEVFLSFIGTKLYIAVPFKGTRIFNPCLFSTYKQKFKDLKYYFDVLRSVVDIVRELEDFKGA